MSNKGIYLRGKTWWIRFTTPGGQLVRVSSGTADEKAAQELHDQMKAESWRTSKLGEKPQYTWDQAALKWLDETEKKTVAHDEQMLRRMHSSLTGMKLCEITREKIREIGEAIRKENSAATANRYLALVRAILRKAQREWEWIDTLPVVKQYKQPQGRLRYITPQQVQTLLDELPEHQREMAIFALATGLRQANVRDLEWSQVNLQRRVAWIHADQFKNGDPLGLPLNQTAMDVLQRQEGKHPDRVFTYHGKPITQVNTKAWRKALERAGIENFRWHDLRHTWASWLRQSGVDLGAIQEMGGWKSSSMVMRYAHVSAAHLAPYAQVIDMQMERMEHKKSTMACDGSAESNASH